MQAFRVATEGVQLDVDIAEVESADMVRSPCYLGTGNTHRTL